MFENIIDMTNIVFEVIMSQNILILAMHLNFIDSINLVLASLNQCIIFNVQRIANVIETIIA
jgi:hypothetical protein